MQGEGSTRRPAPSARVGHGHHRTTPNVPEISIIMMMMMMMMMIVYNHGVATLDSRDDVIRSPITQIYAVDCFFSLVDHSGL